MGRIYRRGHTWHAYWTDTRGLAHRRSLRTGDRGVAQARLRELELASTNPAAYSTLTLSAALEALYRSMVGSPEGTIECYTQRGRHLERVLGGDTPLGSIAREHLTAYVGVRLETDKAHPHSVYKEMVVLRRALKEAQQRGLWAGDIRALVPTVKASYTPRDRWLTREEVNKLLAALPQERRLWVALAVYAGLREGEIDRLEWSHVDLVRGELRAPGKKTIRSWRLIPIAPQLAAMLALARPQAPAGRVVARWGNVHRALPRALRRAQHGPIVRLKKGEEPPPIPQLSPNDLRRTFASWLVQAGVAHLTVAHLLGHTSARMVERVYGHLSRDTYKAAIGQAFGVQACTPAAHDVIDTIEETAQTARKVRLRRVA